MPAPSTLSALPVRGGARANTLVLRLLAGLVLLGAWESVVRAFAPAYVAKPSTVLLAIPKVLANRDFFFAASQTLAAVAQGLLIAIVVGTVIGLMIGRSVIAEGLAYFLNDPSCAQRAGEAARVSERAYNRERFASGLA